jgi:hypothetical protein
MSIQPTGAVFVTEGDPERQPGHIGRRVYDLGCF